MIIGVPKEVKTQEYRVGMVPGGVAEMVRRGHTVNLQQGAGEGAGFSDEQYIAAGAQIVPTAEEVWGKADMVFKVKEPIAQEYGFFRENLLLYTYLHLAAEPDLTRQLADKGVFAIAYETVELADGCLPLLKPMSEIAGKMSTQAGAHHLQKEQGGRGMLLGGTPGTQRAKVVIVGGGTVGTNAAKIAVGMGAETYLLDINLNRLEYLDDVFGGRLNTVYSNPANIGELASQADLLIGAVLIPGAKAPHLVTEEMVKNMLPRSVIVDVAIDQGGCVATAHGTNHEQPTYLKHDVLHYCVTNMPGAVARTSTLALTNATLGYALNLADKGGLAAVQADPSLALGVNTYKGHIVYEAVAQANNMDYTPFKDLL